MHLWVVRVLGVGVEWAESSTTSPLVFQAEVVDQFRIVHGPAGVQHAAQDRSW